MMPRGFKPVGWVAAVGGAALACYMLSLNVAAERAELAKVEHQIVVAKQDIRSLQTELGTRGRLDQLEHWKAEVLALSAPAETQFVDNEMMLARFETHEPTIEEKGKVQLASVNTMTPAPKAAPAVAAKKLSPADYAAAADRAATQPRSMVHEAAFVPGDDKPARVIKASAIKLPTVTTAEPTAPKRAAKPDTKSVAKAPAKTTVKPADPKLASKGETAADVGGQQ